MADENKNINVNVKVKVEGSEDISKAKDGLSDIAKEGGKLPGILGEVSKGFGALTSGIGSMTKAALAFIATPLGLILAGIAVAVVSVKEAFTGSEEGQNKFAKAMGVIGAITEKVMDIFEDIGNVIIDAFENPKEAINSFVTLVKENIINRFVGLIELIPQLGKAISQVFEGDFKGAGATATNAVAKVTLGVEDLTGKIQKASDALIKFGQEAAVVAGQAAKVADIRAKADKDEREFSTKKLELEAKIAQIKQDIADKEGLSAEKRKALIKEAQSLDEQLFAKQKELAQNRATAATLELEYSDKTKENLQKVVDANNAVIQVDIARAQSGKSLQKQLTTINREIASDAAATAKQIADDAKAAAKLASDEAKRIKDEDEKEAERVRKQNIEFADDEARANIKALNNVSEERRRLAAEDIQYRKDHNAATQEEIDALTAYTIDAEKKIADEKAAARAKDFKAAEDGIGAVQGLSDTVFAIASAKHKKGSEEALKAAKTQFKINKALELVGAGISGAKAITTSLAASPPVIGVVPNPAGIAALAFVITTTAASIAKIAATQFQGGETSATAPSAPSAGGIGGGGDNPRPSFAPPTLNAVGGGGGNKPPVPIFKTIVVSTDMTKEQGADAAYDRRASY